MTINTIDCADCFEVMKKLDDKVFDVTFTSPPYNRVRNDTYKYYDDTLQDYYKMIIDLGNELLRLTRKDAIINIQSNMCNKSQVYKFIGDFYNKIKGIVIWGKYNPQPNSNYRKTDDTYSVTNAYEFFFVLNDDPSEFRANRNVNNLILTNVNSEHFEGHGAVMKYSVAEEFILNFTKENDLVFDPFMGCGTTALACIQNKRNYYGTELIQEYKDIAENRIQEYISKSKNKLF